MKKSDSAVPIEEEASENLPALLRKATTHDLADFDSVTKEFGLGVHHNHLQQLSRFNPSIASPPTESETTVVENQSMESPLVGHQRKQSVSMPASPSRLLAENMPSVLCNIDSSEGLENGVDSSSSNTAEASKTVKFLSQPMPKGPLYVDGANLFRAHQSNNHPAIRRLKDNRYNSFKTWSGKLERQLSNLRGRPALSEDADDDSVHSLQRSDALPVDRYFDALQGPELETLRPSEEIVLPEDKTWPLLLRFPISAFGMCLGVSSQAIMWKALATTNSTKFLHITTWINMVLWFISILLVLVVASIYLVKILLYFEAVRREYYHPIRVNFFFAPWISLLFLALGVPPSITTTLPHWLWYVLMFPFLCLELKIYGQWMSGGQRRLSKVANPTNHLSVVGNFVGALLGASMGLKEGPIFFYAVGIAHYLVLFVTLYQRLPTNETMPKELHPVFFLFVAAPSVASMAWEKINGSFDYGSRICYFIAIFLYFSLAVRINFFRGFKFSLAWWAYTFPMTGAAIATIKYSNAVTSIVTQVLSVILSGIATLVVTALLVTTIIHAFVLRDLFPNDIAIAISGRKPNQHSWFNHLRHASSENIEHYLKFTDSSEKDPEAPAADPSSENEKA